jgi:hypothetical protein
MKSLKQFITSDLINYKMELIKTIQLLLYKENPSILEKIDFENDFIFLEPLLFAYFNGKKENLFTTQMLTEILQGYFVKKEPLILDESYDNDGIAYIPQIGYFKNGVNNFLESISIIKNTKIELLKYPVKLLETTFKNPKGEFIKKEDIVINNFLIEKNINALTNAFKYIK